MKTLIVKDGNQVVLPKEMVTKGVRVFRYEKLQDGSFLLIPIRGVPKSQLYFWTRRWQEGEEKATDAIKHGRTKSGTVEELIAEIKKRRRKKRKNH